MRAAQLLLLSVSVFFEVCRAQSTHTFSHLQPQLKHQELNTELILKRSKHPTRQPSCSVRLQMAITKPLDFFGFNWDGGETQMIWTLEDYQKYLTMNWNEEWKKESLSPTQASPFLSRKINKPGIDSAQGTFFAAHNLPCKEDPAHSRFLGHPRMDHLWQCPTLTNPFPGSPSVILVSKSATPPVMVNNFPPSLNLLSLKQKPVRNFLRSQVCWKYEHFLQWTLYRAFGVYVRPERASHLYWILTLCIPLSYLEDNRAAGSYVIP